MNIVSGFISNINTRKDRDITKYLKFGMELMVVEIPMTIFIERSVFDIHISPSMSGDRIFGEFVYRIRGGVMDGIQQKYSYVKVGHIHFVFFEFRDLFLWSYRALGRRFQLNTGNSCKDTLEYMMVQCQKSEWIAIASQLVGGGAQSVEYVWIDFGAFHMFGGKIDVFQTELYKLRGRINRRLLQSGASDRVTFARCWDPNHVFYGDIYRDVNWLFAGSCFGGSAKAVAQFALRVREMCLRVMRERNTLMWEINIWVLIYREAPELFALYPSDHSEILFRGYS
jgi:hypothetical protein